MSLSIQERLKDLRVERGLTLGQLAEQTGLSKSALGKYENDDFKDISPFAIVTLAKFYGVSTDYLLGMAEQKNHPNAELDALHLSDDAIDILKEGKFNKRLLSEMLCHREFQTMMLDAEIYVDRIADSHIQTLNASIDALRAKLSGEQVDDLWLRTLGKSHINEDEYFGRAIYDDLIVILKDIQAAHMADKTTADEISRLTASSSLFWTRTTSLPARKKSCSKHSARLWAWTKVRWNQRNFGPSLKPVKNPNVSKMCRIAGEGRRRTSPTARAERNESRKNGRAKCSGFALPSVICKRNL